MSYVETSGCKDLRVILCMRFDKHVSPEELSAFKAAIVNSPQTLHAVETTGVLDFIVELAPPDMVGLKGWLEAVAEPLSKLVEHYEQSFVCKRFIRRTKGDEAIWVPSGAGIQRIESAFIDKVVADGDYVHLHCGKQHWLLHETMRTMLARLNSNEFVQLHRSVIVRWCFVERFVHEGRQWKACLSDGSVERISKSHLSEVLARRGRPFTRPDVTSPSLSNVRVDRNQP